MAKQFQGRGRPRAVETAPPVPERSGVPTTPEPPVRRWPHPVDGTESRPQDWQTDPTLHFLCCALSYQNELLADIKTLLEQLAADREEETDGAET